jgi:transcriptional regulator with XRE-family HTH domain
MQGGNGRANFWGELILELRTERRLSQRQLSVEAQVNRSTLRRIEDGRARCDIDLIESLLRVLGYEIEAIQQEALRRQEMIRTAVAADPRVISRKAANRLLQMLTVPQLGLQSTA